MAITGTLIKPAEDDEFTFLEPVTNTKKLLFCRHNPCGSIFRISPNHLRARGYRCKNCGLFKQQTGITPTVKNPIMKVHCQHRHCFRVLKKHFYKKVAGEIKCPICKRLEHLDPLYKNVQVQFVFHSIGGHIID